MTKLTSTILGLTLAAALFAAKADASPPVLVHDGVAYPTSPAYGKAGHAPRSYGRYGNSRYGTRIRSPYSHGYKNLSRYLSNQHANPLHGYGTTGYGTSGYGYPANGYNTPGHGGLNGGAFYGSY